MRFLPVLLVGFLLMPSSALAATTTAATAGAGEWSFDVSGKILGSLVVREAEAEYDEDDLYNLYRLRKGTLTSEERTSDTVEPHDQAIWDMFLGIAGKEFASKYVVQYATYRDFEDPMLAYVQRAKNKDIWGLAVNANSADIDSRKWKRDMAFTLVHEYAHILTLNSTQLDAKQKNASKCTKQGRFFITKRGCAKEASYVNAFEKEFWNGTMIQGAAEARKKGTLADFHAKYPGQFATLYAATKPTEDLAESFADFVVRAKPLTATSIRDRKTLFFYRYPELVALRMQIRASVAQYFY